jgi:RNA polymerase sigma-70 factor (ECF subfamily)
VTSELVDRAYRRHAGDIIALLTRRYGAAELDRIEAAVHDAFVAALAAWAHEAPENPAAWLYSVAKRRLLDALRRDSRGASLDSEPADSATSLEADVSFDSELADDRLRMMFVACHPALPEASQVALVLRTLCGLEVSEIAGALLAAEDAVEKRLVRARKKLRDQQIRFELPPAPELEARLDAVLRVLYLLFAEGYSAHRGASPVRRELCHEAQELVEMLVAQPTTAAPRTHALAALMHLHVVLLRDAVHVTASLAPMTNEAAGGGHFAPGNWITQLFHDLDPQRARRDPGVGSAIEHRAVGRHRQQPPRSRVHADERRGERVVAIDA